MQMLHNKIKFVSLSVLVYFLKISCLAHLIILLKWNHGYGTDVFISHCQRWQMSTNDDPLEPKPTVPIWESGFQLAWNKMPFEIKLCNQFDIDKRRQS